MTRVRIGLLAGLLAAVLAGCGGGKFAPVVERAPAPMGSGTAEPAAGRASTGDARPETYTVKRGDTLYGIALDNGLDYREIAEWNKLENVNVIRIGQVLRLRPPAEAPAAAEAAVQVRPVQGAGAVEVKPLGASDTVKTEPLARKLPYSDDNVALLAKPAPRPASPPAASPQSPPAAAAKPDARPAPPASRAEAPSAPQDDEKVDWAWPSTGRLIAGFSDPVNKGLDISGRPGDPVTAAASGRVVYSGSGLRGYGKLIIVKHNNTYLSAYAHNREILVKEGQNVTRGQKIAELGDTDADRPKLHFEIRRLGKPIDPAKLLPERP